MADHIPGPHRVPSAATARRLPPPHESTAKPSKWDRPIWRYAFGRNRRAAQPQTWIGRSGPPSSAAKWTVKRAQTTRPPAPAAALASPPSSIESLTGARKEVLSGGPVRAEQLQSLIPPTTPVDVHPVPERPRARRHHAVPEDLPLAEAPGASSLTPPLAMEKPPSILSAPSRVEPWVEHFEWLEPLFEVAPRDPERAPWWVPARPRPRPQPSPKGREALERARRHEAAR